jgi:hypothetical protein
MIGLASQHKNPTTLMEMKPERILLERNPLSDVLYWNSGVESNGQEPCYHPLGGAPYLDLDMVASEQGSGPECSEK